MCPGGSQSLGGNKQMIKSIQKKYLLKKFTEMRKTQLLV